MHACGVTCCLGTAFLLLVAAYVRPIVPLNLVQAYGGDEILLVADPGSKYGENFYFVLNDALKASELRVRGSAEIPRAALALLACFAAADS